MPLDSPIHVRQRSAGTLSRLVAPKGITALGISPRESLSEPLRALGRAPMCKGLRHHIPLSTPLDAVIAERARRSYAFLDVCGIENQSHSLRQIGPHPGEFATIIRIYISEFEIVGNSKNCEVPAQRLGG